MPLLGLAPPFFDLPTPFVNLIYTVLGPCDSQAGTGKLQTGCKAVNVGFYLKNSSPLILLSDQRNDNRKYLA